MSVEDDIMEIDDGVYYSNEEEGILPTQKERIAPYQVQNNAGGFSFQADNITKLHRFLCLGSEEGTYYTGEIECKKENAACIDRLICSGKGTEAVDIITDFSLSGRACKQYPILFALALCCRSNDPDVKTYAYKSLSKVCRIPTHLFQFIQFCEEVSGQGTGWGRAHRRAIAKWYNDYRLKNPSNPTEGLEKLALHVTKYKSRHKWSHKDVLRLAHVKSPDITTQFILRYIAKGLQKAEEYYEAQIKAADYQRTPLAKVVEFLEAVETAGKSSNPDEISLLINKHQLAREHVPTGMLEKVEVWRALIRQMPVMAMIRNLGKMTSMNLLESGSFEYELTVGKIKDYEALKRARIHPFFLLVALTQYKKGKGQLGKLNWTPVPAISQALEEAYYKSFKYLEPTNKRYLLAVDVSGSMNAPVMGTPTVTARDAAAAMMMVTARTERQYKVVAFSERLEPLNISPKDDLTTVIQRCSRLPFGGTDCSLPILHAFEKKEPYDIFIVYTDSETYFGNVHPSDALKQYRQKFGIQAKLIVCGMASNGFTLANPEDPGMMDIVGFDTDAPSAIWNFAKGII